MDVRKSFLAEYFLEKVSPRIRPWQVVRTDKWKYIENTEEGTPEELYDLEVGSGESHSLIRQKVAMLHVKAMEQQLGDLLQQTQ